jgi:hypothetical protein
VAVNARSDLLHTQMQDSGGRGQRTMPSWFGINDTNGQYRQSRARSEFRAIQGCDLDVSAGSHQTSGALVVLADRRHAADEPSQGYVGAGTPARCERVRLVT